MPLPLPLPLLLPLHTPSPRQRATSRVFIIRHGQTDWNVERRIQGGGADLDLNGMGEAQAAAVAAVLADVGPFAIVASSHLRR